MNLAPDELEVINSIKYQPAVSLILSFEPKIALETELRHKLKVAADNVKRQLLENYSEEIATRVLQKLNEAIAGIDYETATGSLAIYVSPVMSKIFYLNLPVEEKIVINDSFEIRDLIYERQQPFKYIVLLLTGRHAKAYIADNGQLVKLKLNRPANIEAYENEIAEQVANFSDPESRKEVVLDKFLKHIDNSLTDTLKMHKLPVFLAGVDRVTGHFKSISANTAQIIETIHGNYEEATLAELKDILKPHTQEWNRRKNRELLKELEKAADTNKLEAGVSAVWRAASEKNARLLIVEKDYVCPADVTGKPSFIKKHKENEKSSIYIKDAVDDVIEQVIHCGGDVVFVNAGVLNEYDHIALIRYY